MAPSTQAEKLMSFFAAEDLAILVMDGRMLTEVFSLDSDMKGIGASFVWNVQCKRTHFPANAPRSASLLGQFSTLRIYSDRRLYWTVHRLRFRDSEKRQHPPADRGHLGLMLFILSIPYPSRQHPNYAPGQLKQLSLTSPAYRQDFLDRQVNLASARIGRLAEPVLIDRYSVKHPIVPPAVRVLETTDGSGIGEGDKALLADGRIPGRFAETKPAGACLLRAASHCRHSLMGGASDSGAHRGKARQGG